MDHGFYSYSPTFFLDYYTKDNGYELESIRYVFYSPSILDDDTIYSQDIRLIKEEDNSFIDEQMHNKTRRICSLAVTARKLTTDTDLIIPIQGSYSNVDTQKRGVIDYAKLIDDISSKNRIAIYGCGERAEIIVNEFFKNDIENKIEYYFDSNPGNSGSEYRGKQVFYPTRKKVEAIEAIIISSIKYENEMLEELNSIGMDGIKEKVIKISDYLV